MKTYTYRTVWHDHGSVVYRSDGARVPLSKRFTQKEIDAMGNAIAKLSPWKRWRRD